MCICVYSFTVVCLATAVKQDSAAAAVTSSDAQSVEDAAPSFLGKVTDSFRVCVDWIC